MVFLTLLIPLFVWFFTRPIPPAPQPLSREQRESVHLAVLYMRSLVLGEKDVSIPYLPRSQHPPRS
jgi:hypothetical protein